MVRASDGDGQVGKYCVERNPTPLTQTRAHRCCSLPDVHKPSRRHDDGQFLDGRGPADSASQCRFGAEVLGDSGGRHDIRYRDAAARFEDPPGVAEDLELTVGEVDNAVGDDDLRRRRGARAWWWGAGGRGVCGQTLDSAPTPGYIKPPVHRLLGTPPSPPPLPASQ